MIINRYLQRELLTPLVMVAAVLSGIFIVFVMARLLADASAGFLALSEVWRLAALRLLIAQEVLLPIALFLGVIIALGRLYQDHEIDVLRAAGLSEQRLWWPMLRVTLILTVLVAVLSLWGRPWAWQQVYRIEANAEASADIDRISPERFNNLNDGEWTVFIKQRAREHQQENLKQVFIQRRNSGSLELISAPRGHLRTYAGTDHHDLHLSDAVVYREFRNHADFSGRFGTLVLEIPARRPLSVSQRPKTRSLTELGESGRGDDLAERQWRLSTGITTLLLATLAFQLSRNRPRQGRFLKVLVAVGLYAIYFNLMGIARTWVEQGAAPVIWWVPGLLLLVCTVLAMRARNFQGRRR